MIEGTPSFKQLDSPYYDLDTLDRQIHANSKCNYEYTALHLNIQSLPAKFNKLKLLFTELESQHIKLDFVLLCEKNLLRTISVTSLIFQDTV